MLHFSFRVFTLPKVSPSYLMCKQALQVLYHDKETASGMSVCLTFVFCFLNCEHIFAVSLLYFHANICLCSKMWNFDFVRSYWLYEFFSRYKQDKSWTNDKFSLNLTATKFQKVIAYYTREIFLPEFLIRTLRLRVIHNIYNFI